MTLTEIENNEESLAGVEKVYMYLIQSRVFPYSCAMALCNGHQIDSLERSMRYAISTLCDRLTTNATCESAVT